MKTMKNWKQQIGMVTVAVALSVGLGLGLREVGAWRKVEVEKLKQEAAQGCMDVGQVTYEDEATGTKSRVINQQVYSECMKNKGY